MAQKVGKGVGRGEVLL
nr:hypothetical protein [Acidovorax temperans]